LLQPSQRLLVKLGPNETVIVSKSLACRNEVDEIVPVIKEPGSTASLAFVAQDVRVLSRRIAALYDELCDIKAINGMKFAKRFQEVQAELGTLRGITVTWPATVIEVTEEHGFAPGVYASLGLQLPNAGSFAAYFVPRYNEGNRHQEANLLLYSVNISKHYAESLRTGDVIRIRGTINRSLLPTYNDRPVGSYKQSGLHYSIDLTGSSVVEAGANTPTPPPAQGPQAATKPTDAKRDSKMAETTRK
jgi:hypothetical protein